jgi:glyoxylase-like metal-dependent hydrolase (beta-lactamase superfamily II)
VLEPVADGVRVHVSEFCSSNAVVVDGRGGVLLIDAGILDEELACLARDLEDSGRTVAAGFSTHPHWDHLLWHARLGDVPRYGTAHAAELVRTRLSGPGWEARVASMIPAGIVHRVPMALLGDITALPGDGTRIPWNGTEVRVLEHRAHATGHAALLVADRGVLVAGDMLSDALVPMLDGMGADPIGDYLGALDLLEAVAGDVDVVIPGHGSVGGRGCAQKRIALDRAYVEALRDGREPDDPRIGASAVYDWVPDLHAGQVERLAQR